MNINQKLAELKKKAEAPTTPKPTDMPASGYKWVYNAESKTWNQVPTNTPSHEVFDKQSTLLALYDNEWSEKEISDNHGKDVFSALLEDKLIFKIDRVHSIKANLDNIFEMNNVEYYKLTSKAEKFIEEMF
jgi:hypothetical protein